jgi:UDP-glucose:(heptosyl)LPS alpha-1,3-glucosyltransferase
MKLAFVLFKYFPFGGLQWKCLRIANVCHQRGHQIDIYTMSWEGEKPEEFNIHLIDVKAKQNHKKYAEFHEKFKDLIDAGKFDAIVGFNKMPGLDVYYAADPCYQEKSETLRPWYYKYTARYRFFSKFERSIFHSETTTELMMISSNEMAYFSKHYQTPEKRFHLLPPGINKNRIRPENAMEIRADFRQEFAIKEDELVCLMIGSDFTRKGLGRSILALAALPESLREKTKLIIIGSDKPDKFNRLAAQNGISRQLTILSGRDDVPRFLLGSDMFLHPAYSEAAGNVIIEAIIAGLPVLITDVCGYAHHVTNSQAGQLIASPFQQESMNEMLESMLLSQADRRQCQNNGIAYSQTEDLYSLQDVAADIIEKKARGELP